MGKIELFLGPMFSGKTTSMINRIKELESQGKKIKIFKPVADARYGKNVICTHDKLSLTACKIKDMEEAEVKEADVVAIDEFFFFKDNLIECCVKWKNEGKHVLIAGLDLDHKGLPIKFVDSQKSSDELIKIADEVNLLKSKCAVCGKEATMTERIAKSDSERLVGGAESYRPVCKKHHPKWKK